MQKKFELLDAREIARFLSNKNRAAISSLEIFDELSSTNSHLSNKTKKQLNKILICLAESQTQGRGQLDNQWISPKTGNLYLSIAYPFKKKPSGLSGLSLAVGIAIVQGLQKYGIKQAIGLKWPNDIFYQNKKLGGILIETRSIDSKQVSTIIGIGLNIHLPRAIKQKISQPAIALTNINFKKIARNPLVACLLDALLSNLRQFQQKGFKPFCSQFQKYDRLIGKRITIQTATKKETGIGYGIDAAGQLRLQESSKNIKTFSSGKIISST